MASRLRFLGIVGLFTCGVSHGSLLSGKSKMCSVNSCPYSGELIAAVILPYGTTDKVDLFLCNEN